MEEKKKKTSPTLESIGVVHVRFRWITRWSVRLFVCFFFFFNDPFKVEKCIYIENIFWSRHIIPDDQSTKQWMCNPKSKSVRTFLKKKKKTPTTKRNEMPKAERAKSARVAAATKIYWFYSHRKWSTNSIGWNEMNEDKKEMEIQKKIQISHCLLMTILCDVFYFRFELFVHWDC